MVFIGLVYAPELDPFRPQGTSAAGWIAAVSEVPGEEGLGTATRGLDSAAALRGGGWRRNGSMVICPGLGHALAGIARDRRQCVPDTVLGEEGAEGSRT
jgi:hypothetical protein